MCWTKGWSSNFYRFLLLKWPISVERLQDAGGTEFGNHRVEMAEQEVRPQAEKHKAGMRSQNTLARWEELCFQLGVDIDVACIPST